jgi:hypothetical protein
MKFLTVDHETVFTTEEMINWLVRDINSIKEGETLKMMVGEIFCRVYDDSEVTEAFKEAKKREATIQMIAGPVAIIWKRGVRENRVLDLAKQGIIELYYREKRVPLHYRIIGDRDIYIEAPHDPISPAWERKLMKLGSDKEYWISTLKDDFDSLIKTQKVKLSRSPRDDFYLVPIQLFEAFKEDKAIKKEMAEKNIDYNSMSRQDYETYIERIASTQSYSK